MPDQACAVVESAAMTLPEGAKLSSVALESLACPDCHAGLQQGQAKLECPDCGHAYGWTANAVPCLISRRSEFWRPALSPSTGVVSEPGPSSGPRLRDRLLPRTTPYRLTKSLQQMALEQCPGAGVILNLGSGSQIRHPNARWLNLDVTPEFGCDVVGDAHYLPLRDDSVAAALCSNVFEYLANPFQAAAEVYRVLAPGGLLYINVAFVLPLMGPFEFDRFRFSANGLKSVFADLEVLAIKPSTGPMMALGRVLDRAIDSLVPVKAIAYASRLAVGWAFQPLKHLDPWILRRDRKGLAATSVCMVARKPLGQDRLGSADFRESDSMGSS